MPDSATESPVPGHGSTVLDHFVDEFNRGKLHAIDHHMTTDYFASSAAAGDPPANQTLHSLATDLKAAMPDLTLELSELVPEGEFLSGRATLYGTHDHELWGSPGSGSPFRWDFQVTFRFEDDRFAFRLDDPSFPDLLAVSRQLGLINPPDEMDQPLRHPVMMPEFLLRVLFTGTTGDKPCRHLDLVTTTAPATDVCHQCVESGDVWPALRMCLICGFVGCCDTSKNKHMKAHHDETGHPIFRSIRLEEGWIWCYEDNAFFSKRTLDRL